MNIEHRTTPIEHWIVDGKAYRLATEADVGKECYRSDYNFNTAVANGIAVLHKVDEDRDMPYIVGCRWKYAYIQDDSLLEDTEIEPGPTEESTKPIDWTKPVRTKLTKWPVTLVTVKGRGDYPVIGYVGDNTDLSQWNLQGNKPGRGEDPDGLENAPQRIQREYWVNVYESHDTLCAYTSKHEADQFANDNRFACVKISIDCEEGEGL